MRSAKTHYPQVPVEVAKKIAEEQSGTLIEKEMPEQPRGPTTKESGKKPAQLDNEGVL